VVRERYFIVPITIAVGKSAKHRIQSRIPAVQTVP
jgi:hypothetical protein